MAKKVRRPPEEEEASFEFPNFDEKAFVDKETELGIALSLAGLFAVVAGALSWAGTAFGVVWWAVFGVGFAYVIASYWILRRLRPKSEVYTRGDWAGLLAVQFFTWLALWFVLVNVA